MDKIAVTEKRERGQPTKYTVAIGEEICRLLTEGKTLTAICEMPGMPGISSIYDWMGGHPNFSENYARARSVLADHHFDEVLDASRKALGAQSAEEVQAHKLLVDSLKWRASKMKPSIYGDKLVFEGDLNVVRKLTAEELEAKIAGLVQPKLRAIQGTKG